MAEKKTCGVLYKEGLDSFCGTDDVKSVAFMQGFISGEAEKTFLGSCQACMFRPSSDKFEMLMEACVEIAARYSLTIQCLPTSVGVEVWLCRTNKVAEDVAGLPDIKENTHSWHNMRAYLCGIPCEERDYDFHERQGYGERCD